MSLHYVLYNMPLHYMSYNILSLTTCYHVPTTCPYNMCFMYRLHDIILLENDRAWVRERGYVVHRELNFTLHNFIEQVTSAHYVVMSLY